MSLTKYEQGSLRELWALAFPLMVSSFSVVAMVFSDRWILAQYSAEAHNAAVSATTFGWAFICGWMSLSGISEVFTAQYYGAGLKDKIGKAVWQTIWLSLATWLFFIPFSLWGTFFLYGNSIETILERDYFSIMVMFGPFYVLYSSLCGFFVGQGRIKLVTAVVIVANLFNILMDWILVFGIEGVIPSMGVKGAAIGTSAATCFQSLVLGIVFLNKRNREICGTGIWKFDWKVLSECIRIGLPMAVFVAAEIFAFGCYYIVMRERGLLYITVAGICQTIIILFFFFIEGLNKATTAIVGNMIGAGKTFLIPKVIRAGFILNIVFFCIISMLFLVGESWIIYQFLPLADPSFIEQVRQPLQMSLLFFAFYLFFEGFRMQFAAVLTASGDTFFLFITGVSLVWLLMWFPVYFFIGQKGAPVEMGPLICVVYSILASAVYFFRIVYKRAASKIII